MLSKRQRRKVQDRIGYKFKNSNLADQISRLGFAQFMECTEMSERRIMKNKADLFEAILGAVAVDSGWDIPAMQQAYRAMMYSRGNFDKDSVQSGRKISGEDYIDFFETELWKYKPCKTVNSYDCKANVYECSFAMSLNGKLCMVTGTGQNNHEAKCRAYERGYKLVRLVLARELVCRAIICSLIGLDDSPDLEEQEESMNTDAVASTEVHGQGLLQLILSKYVPAA